MASDTKNNLRVDSRSNNDFRPFLARADINSHFSGSIEFSQGNTRVLANTSITQTESRSEPLQVVLNTTSLNSACKTPADFPRFNNQLAAASFFVPNLILTSTQDLSLEGLKLEMEICPLCDDGGLLSSSIMGSWVSLYHALRWAALNKLISSDLALRQVVALEFTYQDKELLIDPAQQELAESEQSSLLIVDEEYRVVGANLASNYEIVKAGELSVNLEALKPQIDNLLEIQRNVLQQSL